MKPYGAAREDGSRFRIVTDPVSVSRKLLGELCDRLEARIPTETVADKISATQHEVNERIFNDRALIDRARHIIRP